MLRTVLLTACVWLLCTVPGQAAPDSGFADWGRETLTQIEQDFALPTRALYVDKRETGKPQGDYPAFMWGNSVQFSALVAAMENDKAAFAPRLRAYFQALDGYWKAFDGIAAYNASIHPGSADRYYDDNEWLVLSLCEAYQTTGEKVYLERAEATFRFVLSGRDDKLGDGIYWHEQEKKTKNTCSNAPAAYAALRLYEITKNPDYLQTGRALYEWTRTHLQDSDGLYFDNIALDETLEKHKWSYNTALMLRSACLLAKLTRDKNFREEALRVAKAAQGQWVKPETGAIADEAQFAHLLAEAFLDVADGQAKNEQAHYQDVVRRALVFLHDKGRDAQGHYSHRWDSVPDKPLATFELIHQASAARLYFVAARRLKPVILTGR